MKRGNVAVHENCAPTIFLPKDYINYALISCDIHFNQFLF